MFINHIESRVWQAQVGIMWLVRTYGILTNWDDTLCIFLILVVVHSCEKKKHGVEKPLFVSIGLQLNPRLKPVFSYDSSEFWTDLDLKTHPVGRFPSFQGDKSCRELMAISM